MYREESFREAVIQEGALVQEGGSIEEASEVEPTMEAQDSSQAETDVSFASEDSQLLSLIPVCSRVDNVVCSLQECPPTAEAAEQADQQPPAAVQRGRLPRESVMQLHIMGDPANPTTHQVSPVQNRFQKLFNQSNSLQPCFGAGIRRRTVRVAESERRCWNRRAAAHPRRGTCAGGG